MFIATGIQIKYKYNLWDLFEILYLSVSDSSFRLNLEGVVLARNQIFDGALSFRGVELSRVVRNEGLTFLGRKSELDDEPGDHSVRFKSRNLPSS